MVERSYQYDLDIGGNNYLVSLGGGEKRVNNTPLDLSMEPLGDSGLFILKGEGTFSEAAIKQEGDSLHIWTKNRHITIRIKGNGTESEETNNRLDTITSPMPGLVVETYIRDGDHIEKDQTVLIIESMKMHMNIKSPKSGKISLFVSNGEEINKNQPLFRVGD